MSKVTEYPIRCPRCMAEASANLVDMVDAQANPELREQVLSNLLNQVTCEACDFTYRVDKQLIYSDPEREFVIVLMPSPETDTLAGEALFQDAMRRCRELVPDEVDGPRVHLVLSRVELVELIFILEAGLDERILEYIKYLIYTNNLDKADPAKKRLLFNAQDSTEDNLLFVVQDMEKHQLEGMLEYSREAYDTIDRLFDDDERTPDLLELFPGPYVSARALLLKQMDEAE